MRCKGISRTLERRLKILNDFITNSDYICYKQTVKRLAKLQVD